MPERDEERPVSKHTTFKVDVLKNPFAFDIADSLKAQGVDIDIRPPGEPYGSVASLGSPFGYVIIENDFADSFRKAARIAGEIYSGEVTELDLDDCKVTWEPVEETPDATVQAFTGILIQTVRDRLQKKRSIPSQ